MRGFTDRAGSGCCRNHLPNAEQGAACGPPSSRSDPAMFKLDHYLADRQIDNYRPMAYNMLMEFEWNEKKSEACFENRGFDFNYATRVFSDRNKISFRDRRRDYGEDRYQVLGMIEERVYVVVYTMRGSIFRIVSARKANLREVKRHDQNARQG